MDISFKINNTLFKIFISRVFMNKTAIFIPARMGSTRFPGKPLAPIDGIPMIVYCARNALKTGLEVYVCTDSEEIMAVCSLYKVKAIITPHCETGTDRIAIAAKNMGLSYVINLQGDEPLIDFDADNQDEIVRTV